MRFGIFRLRFIKILHKNPHLTALYTGKNTNTRLYVKHTTSFLRLLPLVPEYLRSAFIVPNLFLTTSSDTRKILPLIAPSQWRRLMWNRAIQMAWITRPLLPFLSTPKKTKNVLSITIILNNTTKIFYM